MKKSMPQSKSPAEVWLQYHGAHNSWGQHDWQRKQVKLWAAASRGSNHDR